jgi:hypothetical protein
VTTGALIVEDGSIVKNANGYAGVAQAATYCANMGYTWWANLTDSQQEQYLMQACQYMTGVYRMRWAGLRVQPETYATPQLGGLPPTTLQGQSLDWPRIGVILKDTASFFVDQRLSYTFPANAVPQEVQTANIELAQRASVLAQSNQTLWPDLDQRTLVEKVGPIQVNYDRMSPQYRRYRQIDLLLNPFLDSTNGLTTRIVRI